MNGHSWYLFGKASPLLQPISPLSGLLCSSSLCIREANAWLGVANAFPSLGPGLGRPEQHGAEALSGHSDVASSGQLSPQSPQLST